MRLLARGLRAIPLFALLAYASCAPAQDVTTWHYDNARSGVQPAETVLTPSNVNSAKFGKIFSLPVIGDIYAQPLYLHQYQMSDGLLHNVLIVATAQDYIYAFDADGKNPSQGYLWRDFLVGSGETWLTYLDENSDFDIYPNIGIISTPVVESYRRHRLCSLQIEDHQRHNEILPAPARAQHRRRHRKTEWPHHDPGHSKWPRRRRHHHRIRSASFIISALPFCSLLRLAPAAGTPSSSPGPRMAIRASITAGSSPTTRPMSRSRTEHGSIRPMARRRYLDERRRPILRWPWQYLPRRRKRHLRCQYRRIRLRRQRPPPYLRHLDCQSRTTSRPQPCQSGCHDKDMGTGALMLLPTQAGPILTWP